MLGEKLNGIKILLNLNTVLEEAAKSLKYFNERDGIGKHAVRVRNCPRCGNAIESCGNCGRKFRPGSIVRCTPPKDAGGWRKHICEENRCLGLYKIRV